MSPIRYIRDNGREIWRFGLVGGGVFAIQHAGLLVLVYGAHWYEWLANLVVMILGIVANYAGNCTYTWSEVNVPGQRSRFLIARLATTLLSIAIFNGLNVLTPYPIWADQAIGIALAMGINFRVTQRWVFTLPRRYREPFELHELRLGWWAATMFSGTLLLTVAGLWLGARHLFLPVLLTLLSAVALIAATPFLVSMLHPHRNLTAANQLRLRPPTGNYRTSIAAILPAWQEVAVYGRTIINTAWTQRDYPEHLRRFFLALTDRDPNTVRVALRAARVVNAWWADQLPAVSFEELHAEFLQTGPSRLDGQPLTAAELREIEAMQKANALVQPVIYEVPGPRSSKAQQMNYALEQLGIWDRFDVATIFDSEDDIQPGLFAHVGQRFQDQPELGILQGPVILMPPVLEGSRWQRLGQALKYWYAYINSGEYHRWFSGQVKAMSDGKVLPLGGNTVFMRGDLLKKAGGYIDSLAEDCATGILMTAVHGAVSGTFFDPALATREQVPPNMVQLYKQRVRWDQGFLQTFLDGHWRALPTTSQRLLALWVLTCPFFQAISCLLFPISVITTFAVQSPMPLVMVMYLPVMLMGIATILQLVQLREFSRMYVIKVPLYAYAGVVVWQLPYQLLLSAAAMWSIVRQVRGVTNWHRTGRAQEKELAAQTAY